VCLLNGNVSATVVMAERARWGTKRHDQGYGVIGSGVGINQEERFTR